MLIHVLIVSQDIFRCILSYEVLSICNILKEISGEVDEGATCAELQWFLASRNNLPGSSRSSVPQETAHILWPVGFSATAVN